MNIFTIAVLTSGVSSRGLVNCWRSGEQYHGQIDVYRDSFNSNCKDWNTVDKADWNQLSYQFGDNSEGDHAFCRTNGSVPPWCFGGSFFDTKVETCQGIPICNSTNNRAHQNGLDVTNRFGQSGNQIGQQMKPRQPVKAWTQTAAPVDPNQKTNMNDLLNLKPNIGVKDFSRIYEPEKTHTHVQKQEIINQNNGKRAPVNQPRQPTASSPVTTGQSVKNETVLPVKLECADMDYMDAVYYKGRLYGKQNQFVTYCLTRMKMKSSNVAIGVVVVYLWNLVTFVVVTTLIVRGFQSIKRAKRRRGETPQFNNWEHMSCSI